MTNLLAPIDAIADSERVIAALEQYQHEIPMASQILTMHRTTHHELEVSHSHSEQAVAAWRAALSHRLECEIAARRLYKQLVRQMIEHYGTEEVPSVKLLIPAENGVDVTPAELLADLRRLQTVFALERSLPPLLSDRIGEVDQSARRLEQSIAAANAREHERRTAVLDSRIARETYRRIRSETYRMLVEHYGDQQDTPIGALFR